jgi:kynurenine formamidase
MPRKFVDLSIYLENDVVSDPPAFAPRIEYFTHENTVGQIESFFPGLRKGDLPDGEGWAVEKVTLSTHNGTHLDAPYHFHSTMNKKLGGQERAIAIDEVPLVWCFQPAVKLDFRHFPDGYVVTAQDVQAELARVGHTLEPLEIVVVNTRAGSRYGHADSVAAGCGMGYEATMYLLERGVRLTGTDAWSWDAPFVHTAEKYAASGDAGLIWEGHKAGRDIGYCHLEKLHNLEALPAHGFYISCFPHKIRGASAGWTRAVAIFASPSPPSTVPGASPAPPSTRCGACRAATMTSSSSERNRHGRPFRHRRHRRLLPGQRGLAPVPPGLGHIAALLARLRRARGRAPVRNAAATQVAAPQGRPRSAVARGALVLRGRQPDRVFATGRTAWASRVAGARLGRPRPPDAAAGRVAGAAWLASRAAGDARARPQ